MTNTLSMCEEVGSSRRVESSKEEGLGEEDASKQGRIADIDANIGITLDSTHYDADADIDMFGVHDLDGDEVVVETEVAHEVVVETEVASKDVNLSVDEVTLAWALAALKSAKPKVDKEQAPTPTISLKEKGKSIMVEEPAKMKKKDQISFDEQEAKRLQAEFDEEERLARGGKEANVALTEEWVDIQAKIEADRLLAERLQAREQEELTIEERAKLFQQLLEKRRKHFAAKRRPPTKAQQRSIMVNTFVDFRTELVEESSKKAKAKIAQEGSSKRIGAELEQEVHKKQKMDDDQETAKLKSLMEVNPDEEEVVIDAIPLAANPPSIVDWKIYKEGNTSSYQITRADGSSKKYLVFSQLLKSFDREDLETLWRLVKAKHGYTRLEEGYERVLGGDLKVMFEPHVEDAVWRNLQGSKVLIWKLFDSLFHQLVYLYFSKGDTKMEMQSSRHSDLAVKKA
ncbi:hypothetical protein Tco_0799142 [Tanacetum coccineum]